VWKRVWFPLTESGDDQDGVFAWEWGMWVGFVAKDTAFVQGKGNEDTEKGTGFLYVVKVVFFVVNVVFLNSSFLCGS